MPIWSMMCCQLWEEPSFLRLATSWLRMSMIRSAIPFTSSKLPYHSFRRSGLVRMVEAIRAPLMGGFEYMGRIRIFSWDSTLLASSTSLQITEKAPTRSPETQSKPMFLSRFMSPLAKPWYAMSKNAKRFLFCKGKQRFNHSPFQ
uniref:Uncharacterized protein n=1 Tax=Chelydra serpentina TaxID=8475 RepID=A0A8C3SYZ2_CHESE